MTLVDELGEALDDSGLDDESLSVVLVDTGTAVSVLATLGGSPVWSVVEVSGGVLAVESSGYADPQGEVLARLSVGGVAAVVRSNVKVEDRFAYARDGVVVADLEKWDMLPADEVASVPVEIRPLFDTGWSDLDDEPTDEDVFAVGLAMAVTVTGVSIEADDLRRAADGW